VTDADGVVAEIVAPLEPLVAPVRFTRRADEKLNDPDFLSRLTGRYALGDIKVEITLNANGALVAEVAGQGSMELVPAQGTTFGLAAMPSQQVEFTVGAEGPATELSTQGMSFKRVEE
jgi:hypothetical protein